MARMSREESREVTRAKLIASARALFAREGFGGASIDRIAEEAGFSKGAFYSNFESKEDIFLHLLEDSSMEDAQRLGDRLRGLKEPEEIIQATCRWASEQSQEPENRMLVFETIRRARADATFGKRHEQLFHEQWLAVGKLLLRIFPKGKAPASALELGALVMELTYGNAMLFHSSPTAGDLVRLALNGLRAVSLAKASAQEKR
jgi:AcrR family transcriptional regulator